jgi:hypothetical protein
MRAGLLVAAVAVVAIAVGLYSFVDIDVTREGRLPDVDVSVEDPGRLPELDVETGDVEVTTEERTITVPDVEVTPPPAD